MNFVSIAHLYRTFKLEENTSSWLLKIQDEFLQNNI